MIEILITYMTLFLCNCTQKNEYVQMKSGDPEIIETSAFEYEMMILNYNFLQCITAFASSFYNV